MKRTNKVLFLILALGFAVRVAVIFVTASHLGPQLHEYEDVIKNLEAGKGFVYYNVKFARDYYAGIHPLFTLICWGIYCLTNHSFLAAELFLSVVSLFSGYTVFLIARRLFNEKTALAACFLTLFHPGLIIYSTTKIASQVMDGLFFLLAVFLTLKTGDKLRRRDFLLLGAVIGLGSLARGTLIFCLPLAMIYFLSLRRLRFSELCFKGVLAVLAAVLVLSPWWARNYRLFGKFVYMTTESSGFVPWVGFNDNATGTLYTTSGLTQWDAAPGELRRRVLEQKDEISQQKVLQEAALDSIRGDPFRAVKLYLSRLVSFWWFTTTQGLSYPQSYFLLYKAFYLICLVLAVFSLVTIFVRPFTARKDVLFIIAVCFVLGLIQGIYYVEGRHRWAVEPLILLFSAHAMAMAQDFFKRRGENDVDR